MEFIPPNKISRLFRWVSYLDLLGFQGLVQGSTIDTVLELYQTALSSLENPLRKRLRGAVRVAWFSDTFILYTNSGSRRDFALIEHASRLFFLELVRREIPVRGALTYGPLYANKKFSVFIGQGLIDAYRYGEGQDWLGFVLTPLAVAHLDNIRLPASKRLDYREVKEQNILKSGLEGPVYAVCFCDPNPEKNLYLIPLKKMMAKADAAHAKKYEKTIAFLTLHHQVTRVYSSSVEK